MSEIERLASEVNVDFDADEAVCPACATIFSTALRRCPECDLNFG